jgi:hypothetical protein
MTENNAKELCKRSDKLFSSRSATESLWQDLADQFYPERAEFTMTRQQEGFADHLFSTEPVMMRRDLGNAISAMTRPSGRQWGKPDVDDEKLREDDAVREYLDWMGQVQWRAMYDPKAQFVRATKEADHDLVTFGNAVCSVEANMAAGRLLYRAHHLKDCAWAENGEGAVDLMYRRMKLSARAAKSMFSQAGDVLHKTIHEACEKEPFREFDFIHVMMPAADYQYVSKAKPKINAPFVSIYLDVANQCIIREMPSFEFRYVVQRWSTLPGCAYAISPATITALPDARMMQTLSRIIMEAGEKSVDPPMKGTEEAVRGDINLYAGGMTWVDREYDERLGPALEPIMLGKDAGLGVNLFERLQLVINNAFYLNKLSLPQSQGKTAYETAQLVEESLRASAPLFEPMETNNAAILDTTNAILMRVGAFGPVDAMPDALSGRNVTFSFQNPLHDAIERAKVMQYQGMVQLVGMGAQFDPAIVQDVDWREANRDAIQGGGAPAKWLKTKDEADEAAEQQAQKAQLAELMAAANMGGQAAESVGKGAMAMNMQGPKKAA